jgi:hypothetical protein
MAYRPLKRDLQLHRDSPLFVTTTVNTIALFHTHIISLLCHTYINSLVLYTSAGFQVHKSNPSSSYSHNQYRQTSNMINYLWNLCKLVLLKIAAISWNAIGLIKGEQQLQVNTTPKR